jgi:hypothetical protein
MIVDRRTFIIKQLQDDAVVEQLKKGYEFAPFQAPYRVCLPQVGNFDEAVLEIEFKDLAEYDRFWVGWLEKVTQEWWAGWVSLTEPGGKNEIFRLVFKA